VLNNDGLEPEKLLPSLPLAKFMTLKVKLYSFVPWECVQIFILGSNPKGGSGVVVMWYFSFFLASSRRDSRVSPRST
jgi:hypothetical protein